MKPSLRGANGSRERAPDDRLRDEAIHPVSALDCFASLAMTKNDAVQRRFRLLAVALEYLLTGRTQSLPVLLQALLDCPIVAQLFSAKARSVARTGMLLLRGPEVSALG
jgi:hypothetical protein